MLPQDKQNIHSWGTRLVPLVYNPLHFFYELGMTVLGWLTLAVTAITRTEQGDRYLSFIRVVLAVIVMQFVKDFAWFVMAFLNAFGGGGNPGGWLFQFYTPFFLLMCAWQGWKNSRRQHYRHSRSFGRSRLMPVMWLLARWLPARMQNAQLPNRLDWWTYRIVEPALVFGLGWLLGHGPDAAFGLYLQICAVALFVEAHLAYSEQKNRYYDHRDAELESLAIQMMLEGKTVPQRSGVHAVPMAAQPMMMEALDIEASMREILGHKEDAIHDDPNS